MSVINREYDNVRLTGFVREVPQRSQALLNMFLPDREVQTRTFKIKSMTRSNTAASFRAFDTPAPVAARQGYTEKIGSLPPISESMVIGEDETLGIFERAVSGDFDDEVEGVIYDDAATITRRIRNRIEMARGQVLSTGALTIAGENNLYLVADFGVPVANLPGGDATTTTGTSWSSAAATILSDIRALQERSRDENGVDLAYMIVNSANISYMLLNTEIRGLLASNGVTPAIATEGNVGAVLSAHGLPQIVRYDYKVAGTPTIAADRVVFLPEPDAEEFGRTEFGVTAEALSLNVERVDRPGLTAVVMQSEDPVHSATKVSGLVMPVLHQPENIYVLDTTA